MPKRGTKSASRTIREKLDVLNDEDGPDTEVEFFLQIYTPLFGIIAGKYRGVTDQSETFGFYLTHIRLKHLVSDLHTLE